MLDRVGEVAVRSQWYHHNSIATTTMKPITLMFTTVFP